MKTTETRTWTKNNQTSTIEVTIEKRLITLTDSWNMPLEPKTYDTIKIKLIKDDKVIDYSEKYPQIVTEKRFVDAGAYARLCRNYLTKESYDITMDAINAATKIVDAQLTDEYKEVKASEIIEEKRKIETEKIRKSELENYNRSARKCCPICGGYCNGDCEAE